MANVLLRPGPHTIRAEDGTMQVRTYREGLAQKVGHDLVIDVGQWEASLEAGEDGSLRAVELQVDPRSLQVRDGLHGVKPLTDKDRATIRQDIDDKILRGLPIRFRSSAVERTESGLTISGELTMAGATRPARFDLGSSEDGSLSGRLPVTQSEWGIKPFRAFMGALKVRDTIEVILDVRLPG